MTLDDFKQNCLSGFYNTHPKGEELFEIDFAEVFREKTEQTLVKQIKGLDYETISNER